MKKKQQKSISLKESILLSLFLYLLIVGVVGLITVVEMLFGSSSIPTILISGLLFFVPTAASLIYFVNKK